MYHRNLMNRKIEPNEMKHDRSQKIERKPKTLWAA